MQGVGILLLAVHIMYPGAAFTTTKTYYEELMYGQQLSIKLPTEARRLNFISVDKSKEEVLWSNQLFSITKRGNIVESNSDKIFVLRSVTFEDEGTYTLLNLWSQKISIHLLKVIAKRNIQNCVVGESLRIYLGDLRKSDATLHFSNQDFNLTLVERGSPVGNLHPDYMGRIQVTGSSIEVLNVNVSDVGNYTLSDRLNRKVKIISMNLVDHHKGVNATPLMSLLMLLGIPPCIYCCCKKKMCRKNSQPASTTINTIPTVKYDNQVNPPGPPPAYTYPGAPAAPTPVNGPGYPAMGESAVYPPPNPTFPPQQPYSGYPASSPAMPPNPAYNPGYPSASGFPPAQPPQWGGAPYNQPAPANVAPMMYNAPACPEPVKGEIPPTTPLLTPPQPEVPQPPAAYTGTENLNSSDSAVQFNINLGKDSGSNFL